MELLTPRHHAIDDTQAAAAHRRSASGMPMAVGLFNDSGDEPHVAALAASQAHRRLLRRAGAEVRHAYFRGDWRELAAGSLDEGIAVALASPELRRVFAEVDAVVVIGDTMRDEPHGHLLAILAAAQQMDLPTYLVNASIGATDDAQAVLAGLADCTVRDAESARRLARIGVTHRFAPDSNLPGAVRRSRRARLQESSGRDRLPPVAPRRVHPGARRRARRMARHGGRLSHRRARQRP